MEKKRRLKIFLATVGEPIPSDSISARLHKTGQFSKWLSERGHEVMFFNGTFDHQNRKQRFSKTKEIIINENYKIVLLWGREYKKSISIKRFLNHIDVAKSFNKWKKNSEDIPDIIICSYPIEELCNVFIKQYSKFKIPVIIDCRDLWPDIFSEVLPKSLNILSKLLFYPFEIRAKNTLSKAVAISGITRSIMNWGVSKAKRNLNSFDFIFPFTYEKQIIKKQKQINTYSFSEKNKLIICFIGTLTKRAKIENFVQALSLLSQDELTKINFIVAGTGENQEKLKSLSENLPITFLGYLNQNEIYDLMSKSHLGLLTATNKDFQVSIPNKIVEYLSSGLPVFSCTEGEVEMLIKKYKCGIFVEPKIEMIAKKIKYLIINGIDRKLYESSNLTFQQNFEKEIIFNKIENHLYKIIKN